MYSRRKYERKKIEISVRKAEVARLKLQRATILSENYRLKGLLAKARKLVEEHTSILKQASEETSSSQAPMVFIDVDDDDGVELLHEEIDL